MSLAHNGNSQLADSNTGEVQGYLYNNGLSPLGRQVIAEMNRLGMMVDLSHPSKGANMEAMRLSQAPVIASHSGVRALADVSRNMDDEQLLALKKSGGVIQVVGFASYVKAESRHWRSWARISRPPCRRAVALVAPARRRSPPRYAQSRTRAALPPRVGGVDADEAFLQLFHPTSVMSSTSG
jgi:microsomal dipeptidase-like Zn-dependent dipeptidase